ncbi:hypothetical protein WK78_33745 [Burkholderia cepacia]|nr:hypothetical protein WK78_33745 [Burkholderia cepacia]KWD57918.1 hypothetical protein WL68_28670 [Burkholderia cepacia]
MLWVALELRINVSTTRSSRERVCLTGRATDEYPVIMSIDRRSDQRVYLILGGHAQLEAVCFLRS